MLYIKNIFKDLANLQRKSKQFILIVCDIIILNFALWLSFALRLSDPFTAEYIKHSGVLFILIPIATIPFFIHTGLYRAVLHYMGVRAALATVKSITLSTLLVGFLLSDSNKL